MIYWISLKNPCLPAGRALGVAHSMPENRLKSNRQSSPTQDGAEMEDDSSVKGAQKTPGSLRALAVPCQVYDTRYERRQRREYRTTQRVLETLAWCEI